MTDSLNISVLYHPLSLFFLFLTDFKFNVYQKNHGNHVDLSLDCGVWCSNVQSVCSLVRCVLVVRCFTVVLIFCRASHRTRWGCGPCRPGATAPRGPPCSTTRPTATSLWVRQPLVTLVLACLNDLLSSKSVVLWNSTCHHPSFLFHPILFTCPAKHGDHINLL